MGRDHGQSLLQKGLKNWLMHIQQHTHKTGNGNGHGY